MFSFELLIYDTYNLKMKLENNQNYLLCIYKYNEQK